MGELLSQLWSPEMQLVVTILAIMLLLLYVLCIVWVARDAYSRGAVWYVWAIISLVPVVGVVAYLLLRPPMMQIDHDEQELEVALKQRQLMKYGECSRCRYPVEDDYVVCPNCAQRLKNVCGNCHRPLDPTWSMCPYCAVPAPGRNAQRRQQPQAQSHPSAPNGPHANGEAARQKQPVNAKQQARA
jgi:RNA polymerase subunit RPABC4/transcription elongation factor Spt4